MAIWPGLPSSGVIGLTSVGHLVYTVMFTPEKSSGEASITETQYIVCEVKPVH